MTAHHEHHLHHDHTMPHVHLTSLGRPWLRVAAWLSFCVLALWILLGGKSDLYVATNIRWTLWLAVAMGLLIAACDGYVAWQRGDRLRQIPARLRAIGVGNWRPLSYGLIFAPFIVGVGLPPAVLGAGSILAHDGVVTYVAAPQSATTLNNPAGTAHDLNLLQLSDLARHGVTHEGDQVTLSGFIYRQSGLAAGDVLVARFITPHCVAEAQPIALVLHLTGGKLPADNTWVHVTGTLSSGTAHGQSTAVLLANAVTITGMPLDPYLIY